MENGQYVFYDFPRILDDIIFLDKQGFCEEGILDEVKDIMLKQIDLTDGLCEENPMSELSAYKESKETYDILYSEILEYARMRSDCLRGHDDIIYIIKDFYSTQDKGIMY